MRRLVLCLALASCQDLGAVVSGPDPLQSPELEPEEAEPESEPEPEPEPEPDPEPEPTSHVPGIDCVEVQPLGAVPDDAVATVTTALEETYGVEVRRREAMDMPQVAFYIPRKRYRAEILLDVLDERISDDCDRIVGLTVKDISTTKGKHEDWGILGLGNMPGKSCVVSTFRTKKKVRDVSVPERLARVAIHELGHTMGLPHCPTEGCLLSDAGGTVETIDHERFLCERCQKRLDWRGDPPPERPER